MEIKTKRLSHDAYTVALLTPLEIELSAVRYMLDEEHQPLPSAHGDPNNYVLGRLCQHNVIIASLPAGYQGTISAAVVARDLARTFPSVTLRLLVGIGSGVPSDTTDIRLGDVVISVPTGIQGGVVQYDLGKQTTTGFQRKGFLCPPPNEWLAILPKMQSDHRVRTNMVSSHIGDMLRRFPALSEYKRPSPEMDILFKSDYDHCIDQPTCQSCDRQKAVPRRKRSALDRPFIHYGVIASGDRMMKNAKERDMISKSSEGAICFEMEAAGLMNDFRCIVVRGISNYADSHRNDIWDPYAAAAAAALAKELLSYLEVSNSKCYVMIISRGAMRKLTKDVKMRAATIQSPRATAALKAFYTEGKRLNIERISGQQLPMSHCYINLALVKRSLEVSENHQSFSLMSRLKVQAEKESDIIPLPSLFEPRTGSSQTPSVPKRILIEGRAGVGKTTLCKKIVYDHLHHQMWSHLFDWVLWVPLRKLRRRLEMAVAYNLESMFYDEYFSQQPDGKDLARALSQAVNDPSLSNRVLFLLDGLDEFSSEWDTGTPMHDFVSHLLKQPQAIITTRPRSSDQIDLGTIDLELETIGFLPDQVNNYINHPEIVPDGGTAREIESFLQKHPFMQSLMRIPIQLDALCYSWKRASLEGKPPTMTSIYQAIVLKLWRKDVLQLGIRDDQGMPLTEGRVKDIFESDIEDYILNEINLIEGLAFHGLTNDIIEFRWKDRESFYNLFKQHGEKLPRAGDRVLRKVSFLCTSDDTLQRHEQSFRFLHLTFQEFFAARYFVRHWLQNKSLPLFRVGQQSTKDCLMAPRLFLQAKKYDLHYTIYWRFVTGLLQNGWQSNAPSGELVRDFFDQLDREPRHEDSMLRRYAASAFFQRSLSRNVIQDLLPLLLHRDENISADSTLGLKAAADHPGDVIRDLMLLFREDKIVYPDDTPAPISAPQNKFSDSTILTLGTHLKDNLGRVRYRAAAALELEKTLLPDGIIHNLVQLLEDESSSVRSNFESDQQREHFIQVIRQVQMGLGFPTAGTSSDEQSTVPSLVTRKRSVKSAGFASVLNSPLDSERKAGVVSRLKCLRYTGRILVLATIAVFIQVFQVCSSPPFPASSDASSN
ncbi:uncharacterized protein Aud_005886 [Aspergillus udagawae]|uniref:NACHT domain-containing protein n=1 Tax=Aspergillus udagawae TaxID=91492 RepID=A0A8E0V0I8_9EURO|nr:uncharacterized protein Aud_005886 [Aspergillus udagawae]GIC89471.1 hypothetical protein Aud_005886 [Aspergillus udagawae]